MKETRPLTVLFVSLFVLAACSAAAAGRPAQPNVVLILADDLGWQDVKCYDVDEPSPMDTPHLDALSKRGVMFWQAYSPAPTCAPSRCAILSGNHPARAQKTHVVGGAPPHARNRAARMMDPWYSGRIPADEMTIARALASNGYTVGHVGKWHAAISHHAFPQPSDVGFHFTRSDRGAHSRMPNRLTGFATSDASDPFRLDKNGFPYHQNNEDAIAFIQQSRNEPFFLYYATWLVHAPIHTRAESLLRKYTQRLGVDPTNVVTRDTPGQLNPFYCAMVEMLDYYVGQVIEQLDTTDDPRWPGHKLSENTYLIFTSDNGGMEGGPKERYTDNRPLDRGKISAKEGGTRVPLFVIGPGIAKGIQSDVMVNGLDFYPTLLSLTNSERPANKRFDGCDLAPLLLNDPTDPSLVKNQDGTVRDTMVWHFPHGLALESTIRVGKYKLIRNYDHINSADTPAIELFQLYKGSATQQRVDIEEAKNLAAEMPENSKALNDKLTTVLTEMRASYPYYNPEYQSELPGKQQVCEVKSVKRVGNRIELHYQENGAEIVQADLIYTLNGGEKYEEWFREPASSFGDGKVIADLPEGTTHFFVNLVDENRFLVSHPKVSNSGEGFAGVALSAIGKQSTSTPKSSTVMEKDTNEDGKISESEYVNHFQGGFQRKDKNQDGVLSRDEHRHPSFDIADADKNNKLNPSEFSSIFARQFRHLDKDGNGVLTATEAKR